MKRYGARIGVNDTGKWVAGTILSLYEIGSKDFRPPNWGDKRWFYPEVELSDEDAEKARNRKLKIKTEKIPDLQKRQQIDNAVDLHHEDFRHANHSFVSGLSGEDQMVYAIGQKVHVDRLRAGGATALNAVDKAIQKGTNGIKYDTADKILAAEPLNLVEKVCATRLLKNMYALSTRPDYQQYKDIDTSKVYKELRQKAGAAAHHFRNAYDSFADTAKVTIAQVGEPSDIDEVFRIDSLSGTPESQWAKEPEEGNDSGGIPKIIILILFLLAGLLISKTSAIIPIAPGAVGYVATECPLDAGNPKYNVGLNAFDPTYTVGDGKTYATIQAAVDAIPDNLAAGGVQTVEVYAKSATGNKYTGADVYTGFSGYTQSDYIHLIAMVAHEGISQDAGGSGIWIDTPVVVTGITTAFYLVYATRVEGFEIGGFSSAGNTRGIWCNGSATGRFIRIINNIIHDLDCTGGIGGVQGVFSVYHSYVYNNFVYNIAATGAGRNSIGIFVTDTTPYIFNNTVFNTTSSTGSGWGIRSFVATTTITNNGSFESDTLDFRWVGGESGGNNASSDATATVGAGNLINRITDDELVSIVNGSEDLHLEDDATCIGAGTASGQLSAYDIDGDPWKDPPSIGADEPVLGGTPIGRSGIFQSSIIRGVT